MTRIGIFALFLFSLVVVLQLVECQENNGDNNNNEGPSDPLDDPRNYYSADGTNNNFNNPQFGAAGVLLLYENPHITPVPFDPNEKPSPREVSNVLFAAPHERPRVTPRNVTDFLTAWAQFIDHDITRTPAGNISAPIPVPKCDRYFDPNCTGTATLKFFRSVSVGGEFDRPNMVTAWIDGSQIYGSNIDVQNALREGVGGRLRVSKVVLHPEGDYPPRVNEISFKFRQFITMDNDARLLPTEQLFACGDVRCNENPLLLALTILFLREHNRVAGILASENPNLTDDQLFHRARSYVVATIQHITFNEYLFWLMGGRPWDFPYTGYKPDVQPDIHVVFSTVAFRYGHSELNNLIRRVLKGDFGGTAKSYFTGLSEHYFDNRLTFADGIGPMFEGMQINAQSSMDNQAAGAIRNELNRASHRFGTDLIALDIQRGRDHGIPRWNELRKLYNMPQFRTFDDDEIEFLGPDDEIDEVELLNKVSQLYGNEGPKSCDAFACGICEDWVETIETERRDDYSNLGVLFEAVLHKQFTNIRDGDRLWYELPENFERISSLSPTLQNVKTRKLSDVIRDNVPGVSIREDVFFTEELLGMSRERLGFFRGEALNDFQINQVPPFPQPIIPSSSSSTKI